MSTPNWRMCGSIFFREGRLRFRMAFSLEYQLTLLAPAIHLLVTQNWLLDAHPRYFGYLPT